MGGIVIAISSWIWRSGQLVGVGGYRRSDRTSAAFLEAILPPAEQMTGDKAKMKKKEGGQE